MALSTKMYELFRCDKCSLPYKMSHAKSVWHNLPSIFLIYLIHPTRAKKTYYAISKINVFILPLPCPFNKNIAENDVVLYSTRKVDAQISYWYIVHNNKQILFKAHTQTCHKCFHLMWWSIQIRFSILRSFIWYILID